MLNIYQESLESIIKVEPEEFQDTAWSQNDRQSADGILRSKANIFSDPIVVLERHTIDTPATTFDSDEVYSEKLKTLARKGNDGLAHLDPHTCCLCQKVFSIRKCLWTHLEGIHLRTKKMFCDLCPKFFFSKFAIKRHMKQVHSKKKFACNVCDYKTTIKNNLKSHKWIHAAKIECLVCKKEVTSLDRHMRAHRPKVSCTICQKMIAGAKMRMHMKTHTREIQCKNCDETFQNREDLRRHNLRLHTDRKLFECHCGSVFTNNSNLKIHQQSHNGEKLTCEVCQKQFSSKGSLKLHWRRKHQAPSEGKMKVLNENGPFICDKCGSKLSSRQSFIAHFQRHKRAAMFCDLCQRSFNQKRLLVIHMQKDHGKIRSFKCEICSHSSFTRGNLNIHMLRHGSKTECIICHKLVSNMTRHLESLVKVKCPICSKVYSKHNASRHIRTHHNKKNLSKTT